MLHMCFSKALVAKPIKQSDYSKQNLNLLRISCALGMYKHLWKNKTIFRVEKCMLSICSWNKVSLIFHFFEFQKKIQKCQSVKKKTPSFIYTVNTLIVIDPEF